MKNRIRVLHLVDLSHDTKRIKWFLSQISKYQQNFYIVFFKAQSMNETIQLPKGISSCIMLKTKNPLKILKNIFTLIKVIYHKRINVLHAHELSLGCLTFFMGRTLNIPFFITDPYNSLPQNLKKQSLSYLMESTLILCPSQVTSQNMMILCKTHPKFHPEKLRIIREPLDSLFLENQIVPLESKKKLRKLLNISESSKILLLFGIVSSQHKHDLLKLIKKLSHNNITLLLVHSTEFPRGQDNNIQRSSYLKELSRTIKEEGLESQVKLIPFFPDKHLLYKSATLILSTDPSIESRIFAEASSMKRPVLFLTDKNRRGLMESHSLDFVLPNQTGWIACWSNMSEMYRYFEIILQLSKIQREQVSFQAYSWIQKTFSTLKFFSYLSQSYEEASALQEEETSEIRNLF